MEVKLVITETILKSVLHKFYCNQAAMVAIVISGLTQMMVNVDVALSQMLLLIQIRLLIMIYTEPMMISLKLLKICIVHLINMMVSLDL